MTHPMFDRASLRSAFEALSDELNRAGIVADVYVYGGAAIVLELDGRSATRDVDAIWSPSDGVREASDRVADRLGLPRWWLNDQASTYLSQQDDAGKVPVFETPNLRVAAASIEYLIAMKAYAARLGRDFDDLLLLSGNHGITTVEEITAICDKRFPGRDLGVRQRAMAEDVVDELARRRGREAPPYDPDVSS